MFWVFLIVETKQQSLPKASVWQLNSVWQEELPLFQTISGCQILLYLPQERWRLPGEVVTTVGGRGLCKEHRTWHSRSSRSHAFSFFELLSAACCTHRQQAGPGAASQGCTGEHRSINHMSKYHLGCWVSLWATCTTPGCFYYSVLFQNI